MDKTRVAQNFVATYGKPAFLELLRDLQGSVSGQEIADRLGVSRERVRQWKTVFGTSISVYQVHPEVEKVARSKT